MGKKHEAQEKRRNPYKVGSAAYLAYEHGYTDALDDVAERLGMNSFGGRTDPEDGIRGGQEE